MPIISLIAAVAKNRAIGKDNQLLWHLPEDLRHFRDTTRGKPVIMGRKTWESIPDAFRPLPGRHNIVVTRNTDYAAPGATLAGSLEEAIAQAGDENEIFVIGGAELYRQALPIADRLHLTEVDQAYEGDAFFPEIQAEDWQELSRQRQKNESGLVFSFVEYHRHR